MQLNTSKRQFIKKNKSLLRCHFLFILTFHFSFILPLILNPPPKKIKNEKWKKHYSYSELHFLKYQWVLLSSVFSPLLLFLSISLVDKGGTEAQGCVTTVSWHSVWGGVIVVELQGLRGTGRLCCPRAGNTAWAAVSQHIPLRSTKLLWGKFPCDLCRSLLSATRTQQIENRSLTPLVDPLAISMLPGRHLQDVSSFDAQAELNSHDGHR